MNNKIGLSENNSKQYTNIEFYGDNHKHLKDMLIDLQLAKHSMLKKYCKKVYMF